MQNKSVILIVDDTETGREILEALLSLPPYQLVFAANGFEALKKAAEITPDLILLDVMMPGMDGFEVCRRLRADPHLAEIPIILVTALDDRNSRIQGIEAGADDFVTKPFDHAELRARVRTITRLNRYRRLVDERARFEWVVEQARDGYIMLGANNEIIYANGSAHHLLDLPANLPIPTPAGFMSYIEGRYHCEPSEVWHTLLPFPNRQGADTAGQTAVSPAGLSAAVSAMHAAADDAGHAELPLYLIRMETATAQAQWLEVTLMTQLEDGQALRLLHLHDVTAQMSTQRDIWTFHSMVMHKLNTPLHTTSGGLQLLSPEMVADLSPSELEEVVNLISKGVKRLHTTISDILQYLRMPVSAYTSDGFMLTDLEEMVSQISETLKLAPPHFTNQVANPMKLMLSDPAMECVLWELLENAKKFHPEQAPTVAVELHPQSARAVLLRVIDNGSSLTSEQLEKVFMPYYQAEKYFTGEVPGVGLGLTMVSRLLWEVGGSCRLNNRTDGKGVIVELSLPLAN
ncbi:MAG: response regulator [Caldilineaceae bacterium]|nr:response regulator [Caldilineaceae bacterium]